MTDITELALITIKNQIRSFDTVVLRENEALALVEALEKAQQVDEELCKLLPPGAEYMDPPDGGDVTPLEGVRRMVADYRQRIAELEVTSQCIADLETENNRQVLEVMRLSSLVAELESRTVTVKPMRPGHITVGGEKIGIYMRDEVDEFIAALTAAGIKVEAE